MYGYISLCFINIRILEPFFYFFSKRKSKAFTYLEQVKQS